MAQLTGGEEFTNVAPGKTVTADRLNNHVDGATLLNGAVLDQVEKVTLVDDDTVLVGDSTVAAGGVPKKTKSKNLLPQSTRTGIRQWGGVATGTANAIAVATDVAGTGAYVAGEFISFITGAAVNTGATTLNVDGRAIKNLYTSSPAPAALVGGELPPNTLVEARYDGTQFQITSLMSVVSLNAALYGTGAGTANAQTVTLAPVPAAYRAGMTVKFVASVANTAAVTLNVNGLGVKTIKRIVAGASADLLANDIQIGDIVEVVYDGTNFQLKGRVRSWDFVSGGAVMAITLTQAHGLGAKPTKWQGVQVCTSADNGYAVGDNVLMANGVYTLMVDATNIIMSASSAAPTMIPKGGGAPVAITTAKWNVVFYCSL